LQLYNCETAPSTTFTVYHRAKRGATNLHRSCIFAAGVRMYCVETK